MRGHGRAVGDADIEDSEQARRQARAEGARGRPGGSLLVPGRLAAAASGRRPGSPQAWLLKRRVYGHAYRRACARPSGDAPREVGVGVESSPRGRWKALVEAVTVSARQGDSRVYTRHIGSISASPTACPLCGYGRAGTQNDHLGEAVILSTGASMPTQWTSPLPSHLGTPKEPSLMTSSKATELHSRPSALTDSGAPGLAAPLRPEPSKSAEELVSTWFAKHAIKHVLANQHLCWHTC